MTASDLCFLTVAEAAKVIKDHAVPELAGDLVAAFDRLMIDPEESDKQCRAKIEIVDALNRLEYAEPEERPGLEAAAKGARAGGTPFISFFTPEEMVVLARDAGFRDAQVLSAATLADRYFSGSTHGLRPGSSEAILLATT